MMNFPILSMFRSIGTVNGFRLPVDANSQRSNAVRRVPRVLCHTVPLQLPWKAIERSRETPEAHGRYSHADHPIVVCMRGSSSLRARHTVSELSNNFCGVQVPCGPGSNGSELQGKQKMSASVIIAPTLGLARSPFPLSTWLPDPTWFDLTGSVL